MGLAFADNLNIQMKKQNVERDSFATLAEMKAYPETSLPPIFHTMCEEDGNMYIYNETNEVDEVTGKWRILESGSGGGGSYTDEDGATASIGGFESGETADNLDLQACMYKLLHPRIQPEVSVTVAPTSVVNGTIEAKEVYDAEDDTTILGSITVTIDITKKTNDITSIKLFVNDREDTAFATALADVDYSAGLTDYSYEYTFETAPTASTTFKIAVNDGEDDIEAADTIDVEYKTYYGVIEEAVTLSRAGIGGSLNSVVKKGPGFVFENISATNGKICYAIPATMADITSIKDAHGISYMGSYTREELTDTSSAANYIMYTLTDPVTVSNVTQIFE